MTDSTPFVTRKKHGSADLYMLSTPTPPRSVKSLAVPLKRLAHKCATREIELPLPWEFALTTAFVFAGMRLFEGESRMRLGWCCCWTYDAVAAACSAVFLSRAEASARGLVGLVGLAVAL